MRRHPPRSTGTGSPFPSRTLSRPGLRERLGRLPMHAVAAVGGVRIGIVHGDVWSLAGWRFAQERLDEEAIERAFDAADVSVFASSHTCLDRKSTRLNSSH